MDVTGCFLLRGTTWMRSTVFYVKIARSVYGCKRSVLNGKNIKLHKEEIVASMASVVLLK
jgi:hypothetical protein